MSTPRPHYAGTLITQWTHSNNTYPDPEYTESEIDQQQTDD